MLARNVETVMPQHPKQHNGRQHAEKNAHAKDAPMTSPGGNPIEGTEKKVREELCRDRPGWDVPAETILETTVRMGAMHGKTFDRGGLTFFVMYHPAEDCITKTWFLRWNRICRN